MDELKNKNVLIVEDDELNVMVAKKYLQRWSLNVAVAENGMVALELIRNSGIKYDLILMDVHMPIMNGYAATLEMRKRGIQIPVIALTASAMDEISDKIDEFGMNDYLHKPINPDELLSKILKNLQAA